MQDKNSNIARQIGQKIKSVRNMRNISSADMANILGVSRQQLQNYESGEADIKIDRLFDIAEALGVDMSFFFAGFSKTSDSYDEFNVVQNLEHIKDANLKQTICGLIKELSQN